MTDNLHRVTILIVAFLMSTTSAMAQYYKAYYDGPYVFTKDDSVTVKWIAAGDLYDTTFRYNEGEFPQLEVFQEMSVPFEKVYQPKIKPNHKTNYKKVEKVAALSDIHGQYDLMDRLFKANQIVDSLGNWAFGTGHLVITGDIFDRGPSVIEILWYIIRLEHQAQEAGGMVHLTIGNHELMVLKSDLRYIHKKYRYTSAKMVTPYDQLFDNDSFLGQWLRSKPIYVSIDDVGFVHGGISREFFDLGLPIGDLNKYFYNKILKRNEAQIMSDPGSYFLYYENGPLWYRGYAFEDEITERMADDILRRLRKKHIVVGHTSMTQIMSIFNNKIIFIDSSIKLGKTGEILFIEDDKFYAAGLDGVKKQL